MTDHQFVVAAGDAATAIFLKGHLKLMAVGMKNSHFTGTEMLAKATKITGKSYKRGAYMEAATDLQVLIDFFQAVNVAEKVRV